MSDSAGGGRQVMSGSAPEADMQQWADNRRSVDLLGRVEGESTADHTLFEFRNEEGQIEYICSRCRRLFDDPEQSAATEPCRVLEQTLGGGQR